MITNYHNCYYYLRQIIIHDNFYYNSRKVLQFTTFLQRQNRREITRRSLQRASGARVKEYLTCLTEKQNGICCLREVVATERVDCISDCQFVLMPCAQYNQVLYPLLHA